MARHMKGYITSTITTGGGTDETTGMPIPTTTSETDMTECQYVPNNRRTIGAESDGVFQMASYEITTDKLRWESLDVTMISLYNSRKKLVTRKVVLTMDELEDIQRIKFTI